MAFIDLILMAAVVIFIITRFMSTPLPKKDKDKSVEIKVIKGNKQTKEQIEKIFQKARELSEEKEFLKKREGLAGMDKIKAFNEDFSEKKFLKGAKTAYTWLFDCISKDDEQGVQELVSPNMLGKFIQEMNKNDDEGQSVQIKVTFEEEPSIIEARTVAKTAFIDVKYNTTMEFTYSDKESNEVVSTKTEKRNSIWTWAKNITSTDPNWQLDEINQVS